MPNNTISKSNYRQLQFNDLSKDGQLRLFELAFPSLVFGISSIPLCAIAFAIWAYTLNVDITGLLLWGLIYLIATIGIRLLHNAYQIDIKKDNYDFIVSRWLPAIKSVSFLHGIGLTIPFFILTDKVPFEFNLLYLVTVAAIIAAFATHLTPILIAFLYLFIPCWSTCLLLMPWTFPHHWGILFFLAIIYAASMYKHALLGHQFFLKQIVLEDEGIKLAENYRIANVEAEAALKAKNQFLITASHDLRQPVHAMGFLIESISHRNQDSSLLPALKDLKQSVRSVTQMFNSLLDLSKIESGNIELHAENIFLDVLIQEIAMVFTEEARAKNLVIRLKFGGDNAIVSTDSTLLRQSITNLMHNALRFTKHGGILLAIRKRNTDWQIDVWDTGIGVANDDQDRIYSPFFRSEHAWHIDSAGHGLGLAVVARCCAIMKIQYGFRSRQARGSHFWMRLPSVVQHLQTVQIDNQIKSERTYDARPSLTGTCLIVDDDPQVINALHSLLSAWGVEVQCVESGKQALAVLDSGFIPKAILCDQRLRTGESGFDVLRELLNLYPEANGAMVSGEFNSPELIQAENEGYLVLHKPLEPNQLYLVLSSWLKATNLNEI